MPARVVSASPAAAHATPRTPRCTPPPPRRSPAPAPRVARDRTRRARRPAPEAAATARQARAVARSPAQLHRTDHLRHAIPACRATLGPPTDTSLSREQDLWTARVPVDKLPIKQLICYGKRYTTAAT